MPDRPYHHGHLRTALLGDAERTLREQGIDALSLRDLARQAGVSHAAPRRHFADRQALLDALAASGFARLADEVSAAVDDAGQDYQPAQGQQDGQNDRPGGDLAKQEDRQYDHQCRLEPGDY